MSLRSGFSTQLSIERSLSGSVLLIAKIGHWWNVGSSPSIIPHPLRPSWKEPIIIPAIKFPPGTTFGVGTNASSSLVGAGDSLSQGKEIVIRSPEKPTELIEEEIAQFSFADADHFDSTLQHLSELNHTVSQLKQDH